MLDISGFKITDSTIEFKIENYKIRDNMYVLKFVDKAEGIEVVAKCFNDPGHKLGEQDGYIIFDKCHIDIYYNGLSGTSKNVIRDTKVETFKKILDNRYGANEWPYGLGHSLVNATGYIGKEEPESYSKKGCNC